MKLRLNIQWKLVLYDVIVYAAVCLIIYFFTSVSSNVDTHQAIPQYIVGFIILLITRLVLGIYHHIWRYEGVSGYIRLMSSDALAAFINFIIQLFLPFKSIAPTSFIVVFAINLILCLFMRMLYRYIYKTGVESTKLGNFYSILLKIFAHKDVKLANSDENNKINIAIVGAGRTGTALYESIKANPASIHKVKFFIDTAKDKNNKLIDNLRVYKPNNDLYNLINIYKIKEIIVAIPDIHKQQREEIFDYYKKFNCKIKMYDYSSAVPASSLNQIRDFDIEDLMPRKIKKFDNKIFNDYFTNKTILITGAGGSIGSELSRQIASMKPKKLILLDIYENNIYNLQQDLILKYNDDINLIVEIATITNLELLNIIFKKHNPNVVIHAAAHKHVPLMENNPIEAINNNIFGTKNLIDMAEKHNVEKFMMLSTDKAVNPTNIMGATKRFCEIMVLDASNNSNVKYSATRFGNVLGSAGSVVPLFKKQIENGGPITITNKNIIRYFMTIPEASNLVLQATTMAKNGELYILDMGEPVKIYDLAKNMIKVSGAKGIEIVETGLRPGEKLYEEILIDKDKHLQTDNKLIFIEKNPNNLSHKQFTQICTGLKDACDTYNTDKAKQILKEAIPEYKDNKEVNAAALRKLK